MARRVLLVTHPSRTDLNPYVAAVVYGLQRRGIEVAVRPDQIALHDLDGRGLVPVTNGDAATGCELVVVLGGDGTILRGADDSRTAGVPLLGINFGHVGFLAEAEQSDLGSVVDRIAAADYTVEERMTLDVTASVEGRPIASSWALNEVSIEKAERERMIEVSLGIDGRPLTTFGCDGMLVATPTGSTAYTFSAGGPVIWPDVQATLIVPLSAHALFARPLVVGPSSEVVVELLPASHRAVLWCDGARPVDLPPRSRVEVVRGARPVQLARLDGSPFTDRLVRKFDLPIQGWRNR